MSKEQFKQWSGAVLIPIDKLVLTEWNCNVLGDREYAELCKEIKNGGFDEPCQVVPLSGDDEGKYLVIGGEHRYKALIANNMKAAPCVIKSNLSNDEKELMVWSVKRNNIRGKIDEQKYAKLEKRLKDNWGVATEAARREMLIKSDTMRSLKRSPVMEDNESLELSNDDDDISNVASNSSDSNSDSPGTGKSASGKHCSTDGERDTKKKFSDRRALLQALKAAEQEVLLESGDTVEHGYLFFGSGNGTHLVINESKELHNLVADMVDMLKRNSERVDEFLVSAITKELPNWR